MLRRCIWELSSSRQSRLPTRITSQIPSFLSSRNFANASPINQAQRPASPEKPSPPEGSGGISKLVVGSVVVGAAVFAAYQSGYVDKLLVKDEITLKSAKPNTLKTSEVLEHSADQVVPPSSEKASVADQKTEVVVKRTDEVHHVEVLGGNEVDESDMKPPEEAEASAKESKLESFNEETTLPPAEQTADAKIASEDGLGIDVSANSSERSMQETEVAETSFQQNEGAENASNTTVETSPEEAALTRDSSPEVAADTSVKDTEPRSSLASSYLLKEEEIRPQVSVRKETPSTSATISTSKEAALPTNADPDDKNKSEGGRVILDLIDAIHAAERKQAELDAYIFAEEKKKLKDKYEKELKDARARELMYAEEAAILDNELNKEKVKAATMIKLVEEKAEKHLQEELLRKEEEAKIQFEKVQELAKAELAATIAKEKATQIEKIAEANLNINALCMAFYARSEEARQTHSVHKLALGTLALEDALSQGLPIHAEVEMLRTSLEGIDKDSLLNLALSSLPRESLESGTYTQMQLNQKFDFLKRTLRHFSLIPIGGGGILAHSVAHIASSIKMREDQSEDGIESLISRVEKFLVEGKLAEAADALEVGVRGSEAERAVIDWVKQARYRAIAEQALSLLQSYASSITFS